MKVLYQWAKQNPEDWQEIDAKDWHTLPKRLLPKKGELGGLDDIPGWLRNVNVQGITAEGYDHVAIEPIIIGNDEGVRYTCWNDDPDDYPIGQRGAIVWTILPLAPDPKVGMAMNTRQSSVWYVEGLKYERLLAHPPQNSTVRRWDEFVPPDENSIRHGVWLDPEKLAEHKKKSKTVPGWQHWVDHLPDSEVEWETEVFIDKEKITLPFPRKRLKQQRLQGRFRQANHTITYYQNSANRSAGWVTATNEDALNPTADGGATENVTLDSSRVVCFAFVTANPNPGSADWPSGVYHAQLNPSQASAGVTYGIQSTTEMGAGFVRYVSGLSPADSWFPSNGNGDENDFSGTGLKLATSGTVDSGAGATTDVFGFVVVATGDSHGDLFGLNLGTTDSYADGPWTTGTLFTQTLTETVTFTDELIRTPKKVLTETITYTDTLIRNGLKTLTDTVTYTDTLLKRGGKVLSDTVTYSDVLSASKVVIKLLSETVTYTDSLIKASIKVLSDTVTYTDSLIKSVVKILSDTVTYTDTLITSRLFSKILSETVTFTDTLIKQAVKVLSETVTYTDTVIKTASKILSDTVTYTDTVLKRTGKVLSDTVTYSDILVSVKAFAKELTETITFTDTLTKRAGKVLTETVTFTDTFIKSVLKTLTDTVTYTDTLTSLKAFVKVLSDTVTYSDTLIRTTFKVLTETITYSDVLTAVKSGAAAIKGYYTGGIAAAKRLLRGMGF